VRAPLWSIRIEIGLDAGERQSVVVSGDQLSSLKEVSALLDRARFLAEAMRRDLSEVLPPSLCGRV
jgi:hypothetical protein